MIAYFILGLGLFVALLLLLKWFTQADPRGVVKVLGWTLGVIAAVAGLALLWAGRYQLAWIALPAILGMLSRWRDIRNALKSMQGPSQGQTSEVETRFLKMTLEHDTGVMTGVVTEGSFQGTRLDELSLEDLVALWREVRAEDAQSAAVLEAYLDKVHGDDWREAAGAGAGAGSGAGAEDGSGQHAGADGDGWMTKAEALEVLGLKKGASEEEVRTAYRHLMQKLHPDHGGSDYLATKLNLAKRVLIGE